MCWHAKERASFLVLTTVSIRSLRAGAGVDPRRATMVPLSATVATRAQEAPGTDANPPRATMVPLSAIVATRAQEAPDTDADPQKVTMES